jgi:hypothetical protein
MKRNTSATPPITASDDNAVHQIPAAVEENLVAQQNPVAAAAAAADYFGSGGGADSNLQSYFDSSQPNESLEFSVGSIVQQEQMQQQQQDGVEQYAEPAVDQAVVDNSELEQAANYAQWPNSVNGNPELTATTTTQSTSEAMPQWSMEQKEEQTQEQLHMQQQHTALKQYEEYCHNLVRFI